MDQIMTIDLHSDDLKRVRMGQRLRIAGDEFIVTRFGSYTLFVSIQHGHSYTRPQLVEEYSRKASGESVAIELDSERM